MFCPKCGTSVDDGFNFCFKCGFDFSVMKQMLNNENVACQNGERIEDKSIKQTDIHPNIRVCDDMDKKEDVVASKYNFDYFDGSQQQYEEIYNNLCFEKRSFEELVCFEEYVSDKYPTNEFRSSFSLNRSSFSPYIGELANVGNFVKILDAYYNDDENIMPADLVDDAVGIVCWIFWDKLIGRRDFAFNNYLYIRDKYWKEYEILKQRIETTQNEYDKNIIKEKMEVIEDKCDKWNYEDHIIRCFKVLDIEHMMTDIQEHACKNSTYVTDIYKRILDNSIVFHNADYLKNKYPSKEQVSQLSCMVQNIITEHYRRAMNNIPIALQKTNECKRLASMIKELQDKISDSSLLKKGAITLGLAFIAGPLGLINGVREGFNAYEASEKIDKLKVEFQAVVDEAFEEYDKILSMCFDADEQVRKALKDNIGDKYLLPALNDIFNQLNQNNVKLKSLAEYVKEQ